MHKSKSAKFFLLIALSVFFAGCGTGNDVTNKMKDGNKENIRRVRNCYSMFLKMHRYQGPKDKEELMNFLKTNERAAVNLERIGISQEQLDTMWVSERDGEEFEIRWGLNGQDDHAIVFEKTGVDGKRFVCFATPQELEEDDYNGYLTGELKGASPDSMGQMVSDEEAVNQ